MVSLYPPVVLDSKEFDKICPGLNGICEQIHKACKGWGTNEDTLIRVLGSKSPSERFFINKRYQEVYGKDLDDLMKSECGSGDFGFALRLLAMPSDEADVQLLKKCVAGLGTNEHILYTIVCGRTNADIDLLKKAWYNTYNSDLAQVLASELSGDFERLVINCVQGVEEEYDAQVHTTEKAEEDAKKFYDAGQGKWGTDEKGLFNILCSSSPKHLSNINKAYVDKYGYSLAKGLEKELSKGTGDAAIYHLNMKLDPYVTAAGQIKEACAGFGTDEFALTAHIIRFHQILPEVQVAHEKIYEKSLLTRIDSETRGDYGKLLRTIVEHAK